MPTYDYQCDACQHKFELFQPITDKPKRKCPQCKKNRLRRLFGPGAAIMFKGSGFYITDYRSDSYKKAAAAEKGGGNGSASGSAEGSKSAAKSKDSAKSKPSAD